MYSKILIRATNWVGDAVMCLPALRAIRRRFPDAHLSILARPWVSDLYQRESFCDEMIPYAASAEGWRIGAKWKLARELHARRFDCALLLQNAFDAALIAWLARIPARIGYNRDGRGMLLTHAIPAPDKSEIPPHESFYYLELLRRAEWIDKLPEAEPIRLESAGEAGGIGLRKLAEAGLRGPIVGVSPGAAYGTAKCWLPERFADTAARVAAELAGGIALFGSPGERELCDSIASRLKSSGHCVVNFAGQTSLREYIELAAACRIYLTNDSGAMHIASALGVPTVAIFGATDHIGTGPTGPLARVVREPVECAPCLLRECPIDHRCMTRVTVDRVADVALDLLK